MLGGGAWGTALAHTQCLAGNRVTLFARDTRTVTTLNEERQNPAYLSGITLSPHIRATNHPAEATANATCVLAAIPAQALRASLTELRAHLPADVPLVLCAKGIERETGCLPADIARDRLPQTPVAALSGPSFAVDVARGLPTAVTVASEDETRASDLAALLSGPQFRCYSTTDLVGVEIGGALKNVLAIAVGIVFGAELGASAQAALTTRGFAELCRIGAALGAKQQTLSGLSGLGDLILTCGSTKSRNFAYGVALGRGEPVVGLPLAEGVATAAIAAKIAGERGMDAPIIDAVDRILAGRATVGEAVASLLSRPLKPESN